jgi:hypothetical protein
MAEAMQKAQGEIAIPDNVRVVLFKIYERELVASLGELLTEINARMKNAGILPELGNPKPNEVEGVNPPAYQSAASSAAAHSAQAAAAGAVAAASSAWRRRSPTIAPLSMRSATFCTAGARSRARRPSPAVARPRRRTVLPAARSR